MIFHSFLRLCAIEPRQNVRVTSGALFLPKFKKTFVGWLKKRRPLPRHNESEFSKTTCGLPLLSANKWEAKNFLQGWLENGLSQSEPMRDLFLTAYKSLHNLREQTVCAPKSATNGKLVGMNWKDKNKFQKGLMNMTKAKRIRAIQLPVSSTSPRTRNWNSMPESTAEKPPDNRQNGRKSISCHLT